MHLFKALKEYLFFAYDTTVNAGIQNNRKYFLPRAGIKNYSVLIDGRNFYGRSINDLIRQYDEVRKVTIGQRDDHTTGCLLDYDYFRENYM